MTPTHPPVTVVVPGDPHLTEPGLPNHAAAGRAVDEVNTLVRPDFVQFAGDNVRDGVRARVDDGPWVDLCPAGPLDWCAPLPGDRLAKGTHRLTTRAAAGEQAIEFAVDPTGRYTAVPTVRPVVTATNFC